MARYPLPGRLRHPRHFALQRQPAEAQAANAELAQVGARPPADRTAVAVLGRKLGFLVRLGNLCCCRHFVLRTSNQQSAISTQPEFDSAELVDYRLPIASFI